MNSTKIGDALEKKIFQLFEAEIEHDRFWAKKENCRVFRKKGYYSKDREKDIIFDVSIEITLPGANQYSVLVLIECKNYRRPVPVDDVEEFYAKIQQISGANIKGIIASTNSFQNGAFKFSESKGFGLLRFFDHANFKWELERSSSAMVTTRYALDNWEEALKGLSTEGYTPRYFDCYGYAGGEYTNSLRLYFLGLVNEGSDSGIMSQLAQIINPASGKKRQVPYREIFEIEEKATEILQKVEYDDGAVPLNLVCKLEAEEFGMKVKYRNANSSESKMLGKIGFHPLEITIFEHGERSKARERFTLAHELGHHLMGHSEYMSSEYYEKSDLEFEDPADLGVKEIMRMEWQANHFASCLLLPREQFVTDFYKAADGFGIRVDCTPSTGH